jgi:hypothetical protein
MLNTSFVGNNKSNSSLSMLQFANDVCALAREHQPVELTFGNRQQELAVLVVSPPPNTKQEILLLREYLFSLNPIDFCIDRDVYSRFSSEFISFPDVRQEIQNFHNIIHHYQMTRTQNTVADDTTNVSNSEPYVDTAALDLYGPQPTECIQSHLDTPYSQNDPQNSQNEEPIVDCYNDPHTIPVVLNSDEQNSQDDVSEYSDEDQYHEDDEDDYDDQYDDQYHEDDADDYEDQYDDQYQEVEHEDQYIEDEYYEDDNQSLHSDSEDPDSYDMSENNIQPPQSVSVVQNHAHNHPIWDWIVHHPDIFRFNLGDTSVFNENGSFFGIGRYLLNRSSHGVWTTYRHYLYDSNNQIIGACQYFCNGAYIIQQKIDLEETNRLVLASQKYFLQDTQVLTIAQHLDYVDSVKVSYNRLPIKPF